MRCLLDILTERGVPGAHTPREWPVDVVTQVLRDNAGTPAPIRAGMTPGEARRMSHRIEAQSTGGWWYETSTTVHQNGYTVEALATRCRPTKVVVTEPGRPAPITDDETHFPGLGDVQDTEEGASS